MSHTIINKVKDNGDVVPYAKLQNAWRSAPFVWDMVSMTYIGKPWQHVSNMQDVCNLFLNVEIPYEDRIVLASTFDTVICESDRIIDLALIYRGFHSRYMHINDDGNRSSSLLEQAEILIRLSEECIRGVCWDQTTTSKNIWWVGGDNDDGRSYNLDWDSGHYWLFAAVPQRSGAG